MYAQSIRNIQVISINRNYNRIPMHKVSSEMRSASDEVRRNIQKVRESAAVLYRPEVWSRTGHHGETVRRAGMTCDRTRSGIITAKRASIFRMAVLGILLGFSLFFGVFYSRASAAEAAEDYKYYTDITVAYGEDFMDYAALYADSAHYPDMKNYLREVCSINNLNYREDMTTLNIHPGDTLIVPYYSQTKLP